ncbi:hypothetical protein [uncultured Ferrimonas sp.]|uniref:hypothetical protein n=1 Tax=uncultured Ferrimonas sp. TaxID=432640 RepID=UPI0026286531|nr:hypothetical protein [uncultured Ferrimonas sp.]
MSKSKMTPAAADRIQRTQAPKTKGQTPTGSFTSRAQSAAQRNAGSKTPPNGPSKSGNPSGGGRGNNPPRR